MIETSEALVRDIQIKLHPYVESLKPHMSLLGVAGHPGFKESVLIAARRMLADILKLAIDSGELPRVCAGVDVTAWSHEKAASLEITVVLSSNFDPLTPQKIALTNVGKIAEEVLAPYLFEKSSMQGRIPVPDLPRTRTAVRQAGRASVSTYVQNIMRNVQRTTEPDRFTLDQEERALAQILQPSVTMTARASMAQRLVDSIRKEEEAKAEAKKEKEAIEATGFGRIIDLE